MRSYLILMIGLLSALFAFAPAVYADNNPRGLHASGNRMPKKTVKKGHLLIRANFKTHQIKINGQPYQTLFEDVGIYLTPNKIHEVSVSTKDGANTKKYQISLNPGESLVLFLEISEESSSKADGKKEEKKTEEKKKEEASEGFISVTAVADAQVYLDGKLISAKVPLRKYAVASGSHSVRVYFTSKKKNSKTREIFVAKGATMNLHFNED